MNNQFDDWYLYVLECSDNSYYTGISKDPIKRYEKHMSGKGAKYTRSRLPVTLISYVAAGNHGSALSLEHKFKKLKRNEKQIFLLTDYGLQTFITLNQKNELS